MRYIVLAIAILVLSCGTSKNTVSGETQVSDERPDGLVAKIEEPTLSDKTAPKAFTDSVQVKKVLSYLASDELEGRDSGSVGIEAAASYIESYFKKNIMI